MFFAKKDSAEKVQRWRKKFAFFPTCVGVKNDENIYAWFSSYEERWTGDKDHPEVIFRRPVNRSDIDDYHFEYVNVFGRL